MNTPVRLLYGPDDNSNTMINTTADDNTFRVWGIVDRMSEGNIAECFDVRPKLWGGWPNWQNLIPNQLVIPTFLKIFVTRTFPKKSK